MYEYAMYEMIIYQLSGMRHLKRKRDLQQVHVTLQERD